MTESTTTRRRWLVPALAAVAGLVVGGAAVGTYDALAIQPTWESALTSARAERDEAQAALAEAEESLGATRVALVEQQNSAKKARAERDEAQAAIAALEEKESEVAAREAAVSEREAAVTATEERVATTIITEGTWTVGRDIQPGTYTTVETVSRCYWGIYRSGSNGDDIISNDIVSGGRPTVTLKEGQDFTTTRCGSWMPA